MRRAVLIAAGVAALAGSQVVAASDSTTLSVSVTVLRACSIRADAVDARSTNIHLACASSTKGTHVLLGTSQAQGRLVAPTGDVRVTEATMPGNSGVRVITVNF